MHQNRISHLRKPQLAVGARIITDEGVKGVIIDTLSNNRGLIAFLCELEPDGKIVELESNAFTIDIALEAGKRYVCMNGDVVTILSKYPDCFYFEYKEIGGCSHSTESYDKNGFAYHYDCGCNILKIAV